MKKAKAVAEELQEAMTANQVPVPEPGNETDPNPKHRRRARALELPHMEGPGVAQPRFKDLDKLGEDFIDVRDRKAELAEELTSISDNIIKSMGEHGLQRYTFSDQEIIIKPGDPHVKIKTMKVGSNGEETEE